MNTLMKEAAASVQMGWLLGAMTALFFASFLFWIWYAYAPSRKGIMKDASLMPFDGGEG